MEVTASMVKDLREQTGAGMMDCKKALSETNGDINAAIDYLREKGISKAAKKAEMTPTEIPSLNLISKLKIKRRPIRFKEA